VKIRASAQCKVVQRNNPSVSIPPITRLVIRHDLEPVLSTSHPHNLSPEYLYSSHFGLPRGFPTEYSMHYLLHSSICFIRKLGSTAFPRAHVGVSVCPSQPNLLRGTESFSISLQYALLFKKFPTFMEPKGALQCLQKAAAGHCREPDESNPPPHIFLRSM
jgi:hypothetical protein